MYRVGVCGGLYMLRWSVWWGGPQLLSEYPRGVPRSVSGLPPPLGSGFRPRIPLLKLLAVLGGRGFTASLTAPSRLTPYYLLLTSYLLLTYYLLPLPLLTFRGYVITTVTVVTAVMKDEPLLTKQLIL